MNKNIRFYILIIIILLLLSGCAKKKEDNIEYSNFISGMNDLDYVYNLERIENFMQSKESIIMNIDGSENIYILLYDDESKKSEDIVKDISEEIVAYKDMDQRDMLVINGEKIMIIYGGGRQDIIHDINYLFSLEEQSYRDFVLGNKLFYLNDKLYIDINENIEYYSKYKIDISDGEIIFEVDNKVTDIPNKNGESNFGVGNKYKVVDEDHVDVKIDSNWVRFESFNVIKNENYQQIKKYIKEESEKTFNRYYELLDFKIYRYSENQIGDDKESIFDYQIVYKNYDKDPDTVKYIREAKERNSKDYKKLYDEYLEVREMNFNFRTIINDLGEITLYSNISPNGVEWDETKMDDYILDN